MNEIIFLKVKQMENLNKKMKINVREVVFCDEEEKSFCDIFVYEPENIEEKMLGNLYIIGEVTNLSENSSYLINLLASIIKKEFYSNPRRSISESFESSLQKSNSALSDLAEQGNIDWVGNLNMACGAYVNGELHFSQLGKIRTLLVRNKQITDIGRNIVKAEKSNSSRMFTNIASGELENDDLVLFATPEFFNIFSLEKIRQMSSSLDMEKLAEEIEDSIEQEENIDTVGVLIMKTEKTRDEKHELPTVEIETVLEKSEERETASVLRETSEEYAGGVGIHGGEQDHTVSPKEKISLEDIIKEYKEEKEERAIRKIEEEKSKIYENAAEEAKTNNTGDYELKRNELKSKKKFSDLVDYCKPKINVLASILKNLLGLLISVRNKIFAVAAPFCKRVINNIRDKKYVTLWSKIKIPKKASAVSSNNKALLISFVIILIVLVSSIMFSDNAKKNSEKEKLEFYSNMLDQAEKKVDKTEEALIYNDYEKARALLSDAKNMTLEVKDSYKNLRSGASDLLTRIQRQLDIIDLVNRIEEPSVAVDLGQVKGMGDPKGVVKIGKNYYVFAQSDNSIYKVNVENGEVEGIPAKFKGIGQFELSTQMTKTGEIIFLTDLNKMAVFDVNKRKLTIINKTESLEENSNIKDISSYSRYVYLLAPDLNQIYKRQRTGNGFGKSKPWIMDKDAKIGNAVSIAIDGFIYVLKKDGSVDKYLTGSKQNFSIENPSDPLTNSSKIYTAPKLKYLYIVDQGKKRIVQFDKASGKLIRQYASDKFDNLKNIVVDDKEEKIYALGDAKIFEIDVIRQ